MAPVPLRIIYKIDEINYKIKGVNNLDKIKQTNNDQITFEINSQTNYLLFIHRTDFDKIYYLFNLNGKEMIPQKIKNFKLNSFSIHKNITIILRNKSKDIAFYREFDSVFFDTITKFNIICLESYMKHKMKVPLLIQGKKSKRYRIPQLNEFIEYLDMPSEVGNLSELEKIPKIISRIIPQLNELINFENIPLNIQNIGKLIQYYSLLSIDTYKMAIICDKNTKSLLSDNEELLNVDFYNQQSINKSKKTYDIKFNLEKAEIINNLTIDI